MKKPEFEVVKFNSELHTDVSSCTNYCTSDCSVVCSGECHIECVGYDPDNCNWD